MFQSRCSVLIPGEWHVAKEQNEHSHTSVSRVAIQGPPTNSNKSTIAQDSARKESRVTMTRALSLDFGTRAHRVRPLDLIPNVNAHSQPDLLRTPPFSLMGRRTQAPKVTLGRIVLIQDLLHANKDCAFIDLRVKNRVT